MSPAPASLHPLLQALASALSPSPDQRSASLTQLQLWASSIPGYHSSLVEIFVNRELELGNESESKSIRLQAVLQFKHGVEKYWRKGALNPIAPEEKASIRPRLLQMVNEPDRTLSRNLALCIAKIARLDYGTDWNELPESLLSSLQFGLTHSEPTLARLVLHRSLLFLHETIKALSSNRMVRGRALMSTVASLVFSTLRTLHAKVLDTAVDKIRREGTKGSGNGEIEEMELALVAFKCLTKLTIYGFKDASLDDGAKEFFVSTIATFSTLISLRLSILWSTSIIPPTPLLVLFTKHVITFGKLYRRVLAHDPAGFIRMGVATNIVEIYWQAVQGASLDVANNISEHPSSLYPERFVVQSLLLLKSTMGDWASASPVDISAEFVQQFAELLITKLLPLREEDLEKWADDPEEWMNEEEADRWEFDLRPCAEHVLQSLLSHYKTELGPSMATLLIQASAPQSREGLLLKEGVYCAFGRSPSDLEGSIDFETWLEHTLIPEAAGVDDNYRIIRRRIAWLVGNWVGEDLSQTTRTKIYALLIHLLGSNSSTDSAIRLTAARSLAKCDTWDFDRDSFVPFLPSAIREIVDLLGEVELADSQMRLNQTLGVVIDRVGSHILPYAGQLAEILATLWASASENQFQASILVTLTKLAEALDFQSQGLQLQACPIIQLSADPSNASHIYLQEDGLMLWQVLLKRSATLSPEILSLLPLLVKLMASGTDVLPLVLRILESYLLLDAATVLQLCSNDLFAAFEHLLGDLKLEAVKIILHSLNILFQTAPIELWAASLDASHTMAKLLYPMRFDESALIVTKYLGTLSRIVLAGPDIFHRLLESTSARLQISSDELLSLLLTQWLEKLDNMSHGGQRKLTALSLAFLIPTSKSLILERLPELVSIWASVMAETEETETGDAELYRLPDDYQSEADVDYTETLESSRRQALSAADPIHSTKLAALITMKLTEAQIINGGAEVFQANWLSRVDPLILGELSQRLEGTLAG